MAKVTITEALAEIRTLGKRIEKKRQFVRDYLARQEPFKDPHADEGGSREVLKRTRQAIGDLEARVVALRAVIRQANEATDLKVNGRAMSVADWLVWRREVAPGQQQFLANLRGQVNGYRDEAKRKGIGVVSNEGEARANDVIVNIDELALATEIEALEETLGALDGQLSLLNATTHVEVAD